MNKLDSSSTAFVNHYKHLPISERMILAIERQVSLFGRDGARVAAILEDSGTKNGAAIQHYYGDKSRLIDAAFSYRRDAINHWAEAFRHAARQQALLPALNTQILGIVGAWSYLLKQTAPYCYHAGFLQKMHWFEPISGSDLHAISGAMKDCYTDAVAALNAVVDEQTTRTRLGLGALQLISTIAAKEGELRSRFAEGEIVAGTLASELTRYAIELSESIAANLLRERYQPFTSDARELLRAVDAHCEPVQWTVTPRD